MNAARRGWIRIGLAAALLIYLAFTAASLTEYPPPHCDEAYYADTAKGLLTAGRFATPMHGPVYGLDQNHTIIGRLYTVGLAGVLSALGLSLQAARIYALLGWIAATMGTYWLGARIYGRRTAVWAAILFGVSFRAFFAAHLARPEIWLTAGIVWLLGLVIEPPNDQPDQPRARERLRWLGIGFAAALLVDIHFNGAFFLAGLSLATIYRWWFPQRRLDVLVAFFAGTALGLTAWALLHFLPDPALAWYQWSVGHTRLGMGAGGRNLLASLLDLGPWIGEGWWNGNRGLNALEGLMFAGGIAFALYRRSRSDAQILLVLIGSLLTFGVLFAQKSFTYRVLWTPLLWLLAAEGVLTLWDRLASRVELLRSMRATGPALVFAPLVTLYLAGSIWLLWQFRGSRYADTTEQLRTLIPPGATVLGDPIWWFGFQADHVYYGDLFLTYYSSAVSAPPGAALVQQRLTAAQVADALNAIGAQYVILDARLHCLQDENYQPFYAYRDYVASRCEQIGEVIGAWYGQEWAATYPLGERSEVYRCG